VGQNSIRSNGTVIWVSILSCGHSYSPACSKMEINEWKKCCQTERDLKKLFQRKDGMSCTYKLFSMDGNFARQEIVLVWNAQSAKLCFRVGNQK